VGVGTDIGIDVAVGTGVGVAAAVGVQVAVGTVGGVCVGTSVAVGRTASTVDVAAGITDGLDRTHATSVSRNRT